MQLKLVELQNPCGVSRMGLLSHINVYNTCLLILQRRGFTLRVDGEMTSDGCYPPDALWIGQKGEFYFCGNNPIELLGLVAIYDHVQPKEEKPYWWKLDGPDLWTELMEAAFPDEGQTSN